MAPTGISFVIPCLNEERNLGTVISRIQEIAAGPLKNREIEILISDNGSTDRSVAIARDMHASVVHCPTKGYGANLKYGIAHAKHPIVIFADADNTYDLRQSPTLIAKLESEKADLVLGSRFKGKIDTGAMPLLHRYLGTPMLTFLFNFFHGSRKRQSWTSDANSGFRAFYKDKYDTWGIISDGMDFASEMLLKAFKREAVIREVPITLTRNDKERIPHLKTWQDGMKQLLRFFIETPDFFLRVGVLFLVLGLFILIPSYAINLYRIGDVEILGPHTTLFANLIVGVGIQLWGLGALVSLKDYKGNYPIRPVYKSLIEFREDKLFWFIFLWVVFVIVFVVVIFIIWKRSHFSRLDLQDEIGIMITFITGLSYLIVNILAIHVLKRV